MNTLVNFESALPSINGQFSVGVNIPGEIIAAFLWAQLEEAERITKDRLASWARYHELLEPLEERGMLHRPVIPEGCRHNAHMYYVRLTPDINRQQILSEMKQKEIYSIFHYVPLHSSPAGQRYGREHGVLDVTNRQAEKLIRLPLWVGLSSNDQKRVVEVLFRALSGRIS